MRRKEIYRPSGPARMKGSLAQLSALRSISWRDGPGRYKAVPGMKVIRTPGCVSASSPGLSGTHELPT